MVTELPLLMANGTFKYLDSMQDQQLESFLSYLVRYCSEKYCEDPTMKPKWWGKEVKFYPNFYTGTISLPFIKHKQVGENKERKIEFEWWKTMKLRTIIRSCYAYYDAIPLLLMSEKLASRLTYDFEKNSNDTVTVNVANTKKPVIVIPASNCASLISYDCRIIVNINDSESDSDCMIIDDISSDEEVTTVIHRKSSYAMADSNDEYQESYDDEFMEPENERRDEEVQILRRGLACIDLTLDEDDEERRAIREAEKARFLEEFGLSKRGAAPPDQMQTPVKDHKRKSRFSLKKFSLDQVPFLVRIGLLPRRCLVTVHEISTRTSYIEKYTRNN
ncbi:hypothetical protein GE061_008554 [Apolygus lucorum]|uniref:Nuclear respiratory factor 1 NLS/DNA-binding dimerisation domain-containing protein n=1 Tax=Apolygus lucorum TaxID=248454 RepID=A0A8S9WMU7_APOLU|nr:hypothetical protein GE061_008554 [Apolygus lucorum]